MQKPDVWRELKRLEYEKVKKEQDPNFKKEVKEGNNTAEESRLQFEDFEQEMQFDNARDANMALLDKELSTLRKEEENAANIIGKEAKVRFNLADTRKRDDSFADEYLDLMNKQGALNAKYEPEFTIQEDSKEYQNDSTGNGVDWYQDGKITKIDLAPGNENNGSSLRMSRNGSRVLSNSGKFSAWDLSNKNY